MRATRAPRSDALVLFGASGDLAAKMLWPAVYRLEESGDLAGMPVVGVAASGWDDAALRDYARASLDRKQIAVAGDLWDRLAERISYVRGDYGDPATYRVLAAALDSHDAPLIYLSHRRGCFSPIPGNTPIPTNWCSAPAATKA